MTNISENGFRTKLSQRDRMSVTTIKYFSSKSRRDGIKYAICYAIPTGFDLFVSVLATNIESLRDFKNRKPFSN